MEIPKPPEISDRIEVPLIEEWKVGKRRVEPNRLFEAGKAYLDFGNSRGGRARITSIMTSSQYYSGINAQGESYGAD